MKSVESVLGSVMYSVLFAKKISLGSSTIWRMSLFIKFSFIQCLCLVRSVHVYKDRRF